MISQKIRLKQFASIFIDTDKFIYIIEYIQQECGVYSWDPEKSCINKKKHGFTFDEILEVFDDPQLLEWADWEHSTLEETRYQCIGLYECFLLILVVYTDRDGSIRIISAREASPKEKKAYYEYEKKR